MAGYDVYRNGLRGAVRGLWGGAISQDQFERQVKKYIETFLHKAWLEGASKCGITEGEMTDDEFKSLSDIVKNELQYLPGFAKAIIERNKKSGGKLPTLMERAELWANRYPDVVDRAKIMACGDKKYVWMLGPTEEHCTDCSKYNGKVYRGSTWAKYDIRPKHPNLECNGFNCLCRLDETTKPVNKGRPPAMTGG